MLKKIIIISSTIIVIIIMALLSYNYFFKTEDIKNQTTEFESDVIVFGSDIATETSRLKIVSYEPILNAVIDNSTVKYYSSLNGNVFRSNFDGSNTSIISADILMNLIKAEWSPTDTTKLIAFFDEGSQIKKYFYDFKSNQSTELSSNICNIAWSPTENKVAYQYYDAENGFNNISIANPDGSDWNNILETRIKDLIIEWPSSDLISIRTRPSGLAQSVLYTLTTNGSNFSKLIGNTYGLTVLWSPQGDKLIYSETNSQGRDIKLKILNISDQTERQLDFKTLPEKCIWSKDNIAIYCAIPKAIADQAILPDDYYKNYVEFSDNIYKINLNTGQTTLLLESNSTMLNADKLLIDNNESYLIFINKLDDSLYSLEL